MQLGTTLDGVQKGLAHQVMPDDVHLPPFHRQRVSWAWSTPEQMHDLIKDWDSFLATAQKLRDAFERQGGHGLWYP